MLYRISWNGGKKIHIWDCDGYRTYDVSSPEGKRYINILLITMGSIFTLVSIILLIVFGLNFCYNINDVPAFENQDMRWVLALPGAFTIIGVVLIFIGLIRKMRQNHLSSSDNHLSFPENADVNHMNDFYQSNNMNDTFKVKDDVHY